MNRRVESHRVGAQDLTDLTENSKRGMADLEQPLLHPKPVKVYPKCPGCKVAHLVVDGAPPAYKELSFVAIMMLSNGALSRSPNSPQYFSVYQYSTARSRHFPARSLMIFPCSTYFALNLRASAQHQYACIQSAPVIYICSRTIIWFHLEWPWSSSTPS